MPDIVFIGPPGAGKGTQAAFICQSLNIPHVSAGDLLRAALAEQSQIGLQAKKYVEAGELVPDELVAELLTERFSKADAKGGVLIDGFPRNAEQVGLLDGILQKLGRKLDAVINLDVNSEELVKRLTGRRMCAGCGKIFNINLHAEIINAGCDACGSKEFNQRKDDTEEVIRNRLNVYREHTAPLIEIYQQRGILKQIDGAGVPQQTSRQIEQALSGVAK